MSDAQQSLTAFGTEAGATDRPGVASTIGAETDAHRTCQNCGAHVSARYRQTAGDEDGRVYGCPACYGTAEILRGAYQQGEDGDQEIRVGRVTE